MPLYENVRNEDVAVGTTAVRLSVGHVRQELTIENSSTGGQVLRLAFGKVASTTIGMPMQPYTFYSVTAGERFRIFAGDIWIISSAAGGQVSIFER